jgi:hypothetical protein
VSAASSRSIIPPLIPIPSPVQSPEPSPPNNPLPRIPSDIKLNKPPIFTGKDLSLAKINTWAIRAEDYIEDITDETRKIKVAGSFLTEIAELWYIISIRNSIPMMVIFAIFLAVFKAHFSRADESYILRDQL